MKKSVVKKAGQFLVMVLVVTVPVMGLKIFTSGMYLIGIPNIDDVQLVRISYPEMTDEIREVSDEEQLELAVKLTGSLRFSVFELAPEDETPLITINYLLDNGETITVSANRETVWWNGRARVIKDRGAFINLTKAIFFLSESMAA